MLRWDSRDHHRVRIGFVQINLNRRLVCAQVLAAAFAVRTAHADLAVLADRDRVLHLKSGCRLESRVHANRERASYLPHLGSVEDAREVRIVCAVFGVVNRRVVPIA